MAKRPDMSARTLSVARAIHRGYRTNVSISKHLGQHRDSVKNAIATLRRRGWVTSPGTCNHQLAAYDLTVSLAVIESELCTSAFDAGPLAEALHMPVALPVHAAARVVTFGGFE